MEWISPGFYTNSIKKSGSHPFYPRSTFYNMSNLHRPNNASSTHQHHLPKSMLKKAICRIVLK